MELKVSAVFKVVDESGECFEIQKVSAFYDVIKSNKLETKKDIYDYLKSEVFIMDEYQKVEDLTEEELKEYKRQKEK